MPSDRKNCLSISKILLFRDISNQYPLQLTHITKLPNMVNIFLVSGALILLLLPAYFSQLYNIYISPWLVALLIPAFILALGPGRRYLAITLLIGSTFFGYQTLDSFRNKEIEVYGLKRCANSGCALVVLRRIALSLAMARIMKTSDKRMHGVEVT
jgi:hypothetical protein